MKNVSLKKKKKNQFMCFFLFIFLRGFMCFLHDIPASYVHNNSNLPNTVSPASAHQFTVVQFFRSHILEYVFYNLQYLSLYRK